jgi:hypothetical protein
MNKTLIGALIAATAFLAPAAAQAATVSLDKGTIVYQGEGTEGLSLLVTTYQPWGDPSTYLALSDSGADRQAILAGTPCKADAAFGVLCPLDLPLRVEGSDGNDRLSVYDDDTDGVPITIHGNAGNDEIKDAFGGNAGRVLTGGPGNDTVEGGRGNDTVTGGPGRDTIYGDATSSHCSWYSCKVPFGNDTIHARDGEVDNIDCGIGTDQAIVDTIDIVANCENVGAAAPQTGGAVAFKVKKTRLRTLARKGLKVVVTCPSACKASGALLLGGRKVGAGRAQGTGTVSLELRLDGKGKRRVKRLRRAKLTVRVTTTPGGSATQTLTLKR